MYGIVSVISGMAIIWSITAISVERAVVVHLILRAKDHRVNKVKMRMVLAGMWIAAVAASLPPLMGWNRYVYEVFQNGFDSI